MFAKPVQHIAQALALVFTTVVAPVVVSVVVHDLNGDNAAKVPIEQTASRKEELLPTNDPVISSGATYAQTAQSLPSKRATNHVTIHPAALIPLRIQGTGRTPDEAFQQALRTALYKVVVAEFGADCWTQRGQAIFEAAWHNAAGIVRTWKTLDVTMARQSSGLLYHATAAIEVDRRSLLARLESIPAQETSSSSTLPSSSDRRP